MVKRIVTSVLLLSCAGFAQVTYSGRVTVSGPDAAYGTPLASVSPASIAYGSIAVGASSNSTVTLQNTGGSNLTISSISITLDATDYSIISNNCASPLAASASCTVVVSFAPASSGLKSGTLSFTDGAVGSPHTVSLTGTGTSLRATGCGNSLVNDNTTCGNVSVAGYSYNDCGANCQDTAINAGTGGTLISVCGYSIPASGSYYINADLNCTTTANAFTIPGRKNVLIDLNGHTVTGTILANGNNGSNDGLHIFHGSVTSATNNQTSATIFINNNGAYTDTGTISLHHLTVQNTYDTGCTIAGTGNPYVIYLDDGGTSHTWSATHPILLQYITGSLTNANCNASRSSVIMALGGKAPYIFSNSVHIGTQEGSSQGLVAYGSQENTKIINNLIITDLSAIGAFGAATPRGSLIDSSSSAVAAGLATSTEVANNDYTSNDARAVRIRDSQNVWVHGNYAHGIRGSSGGPSGTLGNIHLGDPDTTTGGIIDCSTWPSCFYYNTVKNYAGHTGDYLTFSSVTSDGSTSIPSLNEAIAITSLAGAGTFGGVNYFSKIGWTDTNASNTGVTSYIASGSLSKMESDPTDVSNAIVENNTFNVDCSVDKGGIVWAVRASSGDITRANTITTTGDCTTTFTGALYKPYLNKAYLNALVESTTGFSLLQTQFAVQGSATPGANPSGTASQVKTCSSGTNDGNGIWNNVVAPCP